MTRLGLALVVVVGAATLTFAQAVGQRQLSFEAASVKPNTSDGEPLMNVPTRGQVVIINVPLLNVIINAFRVRPFHVVGGPDWIRSERFDITAKPPDDGTPDPLLMLQTLLAQRFGLRVHREVRDEPIYTLVLARNDGRFGPRLQQSKADCATIDKQGIAANANALSQKGPCVALAGFSRDGGGMIVSNGRPLARFVSAVSMAVNRTVVDRTGIEGPLDIDLQWGPDVNPATASTDAPSIFTAVQEQLGLRLEPARGPVELLVIDFVDRPTPD